MRKKPDDPSRRIRTCMRISKDSRPRSSSEKFLFFFVLFDFVNVCVLQAQDDHNKRMLAKREDIQKLSSGFAMVHHVSCHQNAVFRYERSGVCLMNKTYSRSLVTKHSVELAAYMVYGEAGAYFLKKRKYFLSFFFSLFFLSDSCISRGSLKKTRRRREKKR